MTNTINVGKERLGEFDRVFNLFDANADGSLTRQEITEALEVLGKGISLSDRAQLLYLEMEKTLLQSASTTIKL